MGKQLNARIRQAEPKKYGRSFPISGEPQADPKPEKVMEGGYGTVKSTRKKESAIVKRSRAQLIQRLGILPRKAK